MKNCALLVIALLMLPDLGQSPLFLSTYAVTVLPLTEPDSPSQYTTFTAFDISSANIFVGIGDRLGIVVSRGSGATDAIEEWVLWGRNADLYAGGAAYYYRPAFNAWSLAGGDHAFRTYISSVPVPAAVWLFGSALGLVGMMRRKAA